MIAVFLQVSKHFEIYFFASRAMFSPGEESGTEPALRGLAVLHLQRCLGVLLVMVLCEYHVVYDDHWRLNVYYCIIITYLEIY